MIKFELVVKSRLDEERAILGGRYARMATDLSRVHDK
jgi:hypothetical protein